MIKLSNVTKKFGSQQVLDNFSLKIKNGDKLCFMGRSGMGKTTLLNIIMGLEGAYDGDVLIDDNESFACVFQENRLIEEMTASKNILLVCNSKKDVLPFAQQLGLDKEALEKPVKLLSGGEKRRVAILRAFMSDSTVIVLDEALQGLDNKTEKQVIRLVNETLKGRTLIAVSHNKAEAEGYGCKIIEL